MCERMGQSESVSACVSKWGSDCECEGGCKGENVSVSVCRARVRERLCVREYEGEWVSKGNSERASD